MNTVFAANFEEMLAVSAEDSDITVLQSDICISSTEKLNLKTSSFDLSGHTLTIETSEGLTVTRGKVLRVYNGTIVVNSSNGISVHGANASLILGSRLTVLSKCTAVYVYTGGKLLIDDAQISCSGNDPVIFVTGANSRIEFNAGSINTDSCSGILIKGDGIGKISGNSKINSYKSAGIVISGKNSILDVIDNASISATQSTAIRIAGGSSCTLSKTCKVTVEDTEADPITVEGNNSNLVIEDDITAVTELSVVEATEVTHVSDINESVAEFEIAQSSQSDTSEPAMLTFTSAVLLKSTNLYMVPGSSSKVFKHIGPVSIYPSDIVIHDTIKYVKVKITESGTGRKLKGFMSVGEILRNRR